MQRRDDCEGERKRGAGESHEDRREIQKNDILRIRPPLLHHTFEDSLLGRV